MTLARIYLRASTNEQDATRAKQAVTEFAKEKNLQIASYYVENESGAKLDRPELMRLLNDCQQGDVLLVEQIDRLSRLKQEDWAQLKAMIASRGVRVVSMDLPTSSMNITATDEVTQRLMQAVNDMLLDMLAAIANKDYEDRRRRQKQGIEKAKAEGKFKGRAEDTKKHKQIEALLRAGHSWTDVQGIAEVSRSTIKRVNDKIKAEAVA